MNIELSPEEIEILNGWYLTAASESAGAETEEEFRLLEKLGIEASDRDLYPPTPEHWVESHRPAVLAQVAAINGYMERNPDLESVREAKRLYYK